MTTNAVVAAARACLGTPFRHQARVPGLGLDCVGLLAHVFESLTLPYEDETGYPRTPFGGKLERNLDAQPSLRRVPLDEMAAGDVLVMRIKSAPQHVAIHSGEIGGHVYIIHASEEHGGVVEHRLDAMWGARVMRAYRVERPV